MALTRSRFKQGESAGSLVPINGESLRLEGEF